MGRPIRSAILLVSLSMTCATPSPGLTPATPRVFLGNYDLMFLEPGSEWEHAGRFDATGGAEINLARCQAVAGFLAEQDGFVYGCWPRMDQSSIGRITIIGG